MNKKPILIVFVVLALLVGLVVIGVLTLNKPNELNKTKAQNIESNDNENRTSQVNIEKNETDETNKTNEVQTDKTSDKKVAVVYFSATGTTKKVAELIKDETNSEIFEIIPKQKYTSEDLNYGDNNTRATKEQNDENARPEIAENIDLSNYDVIFLGYPIWWGNVPKIILTFIDKTNLDGKTIIPFCTSGSSGISTSEDTLKSYKSSINWISGNRFSSSASNTEVSNWINSLNY